MRIIVSRNTFIGGALVEASPVPLDVDAVVGKQLIALGKAVAVPEPPAANPAAPVAVETPAESAPAPKEEKPRAKGK